MKMLYILNVANRVNNFCMSSLMAAKELNVEYHIAGNWSYKDDAERKADEEKYGIHIYQVDFMRSPISLKNKKAYQQLKEIVAREQFDVIHCNTPIGGVLGRLVAKKYKTKHVIYQVHGFHFYKGAPKLNWLIYYPIEKWLARYTDTLITINQEDYELAQAKFHLRKNGRIYYVPGVGIDLSQYPMTKKRELRASIGIGENDVMLISVGDLVEKKNYKASIKAIAEAALPNLKYCICGTGPQQEELTEYVKSFGVEEQVLFLGFRSDMKELLQVADIFLLTTKQEGLPRSMMEAMASGLPCIASEVRGNTDLLKDGVGGYLCHEESSTEFAEAIKKLACDSEKRRQFGEDNLKHILEFDISEIANQMRDIYVSECISAENAGEVNNFDVSKFYPARVRKRLELGLSLDDIVLISAGRLDANKNNQITIRALAQVPNVKFLLCGDGEQRDQLVDLAKSLGVENRVLFLGNRTDIVDLYQAADIFVMMSFREGLSRSIMEAMASGLPCIASNIRGNDNLIIYNNGGYLVQPTDVSSLVDKIQYLISHKDICSFMSTYNKNMIHNFSLEKVVDNLNYIYNATLSN